MAQLLLFPDPRPLVERLGADFFRHAPELPGVYLMRDAANQVLYVGKARNLRKRLASYRVANPDRLRRRHLRLLNSIERIELQECASEEAALAREAELLRGLKPRFNRAGTWVGPRRYVTWKTTSSALELAVTESVMPGSSFHGPLGSSAVILRAILVRLLWCALCPERGLRLMPQGWFHGRLPASVTIPSHSPEPALLEGAASKLTALFTGGVDLFARWIQERTVAQTHPFEKRVLQAHIEELCEWVVGTQK